MARWRSDMPLGWAEPDGSGRGVRSSMVPTSSRPGHQRLRSSATILVCRTSSRVALQAIRWVQRALTLSGGEYAIHGTNRPESIGTYPSYGRIRMFNEDIVDLFSRVRVGTEVVVAL